MKSGKIIQLLRTAEGISQFELAGRLGISRAYLSQVENNHKQPSILFLKKVSENFKVPLILLIKNEDDIDYGLNDELKKILSDVLSAKISIINKTK